MCQTILIWYISTHQTIDGSTNISARSSTGGRNREKTQWDAGQHWGYGGSQVTETALNAAKRHEDDCFLLYSIICLICTFWINLICWYFFLLMTWILNMGRMELPAALSCLHHLGICMATIIEPWRPHETIYWTRVNHIKSHTHTYISYILLSYTIL